MDGGRVSYKEAVEAIRQFGYLGIERNEDVVILYADDIPYHPLKKGGSGAISGPFLFDVNICQRLSRCEFLAIFSRGFYVNNCQCVKKWRFYGQKPTLWPKIFAKMATTFDVNALKIWRLAKNPLFFLI